MATHKGSRWPCIHQLLAELFVAVKSRSAEVVLVVDLIDLILRKQLFVDLRLLDLLRVPVCGLLRLQVPMTCGSLQFLVYSARNWPT